MCSFIHGHLPAKSLLYEKEAVRPYDFTSAWSGRNVILLGGGRGVVRDGDTFYDPSRQYDKSNSIILGKKHCSPLCIVFILRNLITCPYKLP